MNSKYTTSEERKKNDDNSGQEEAGPAVSLRMDQ